MQRYAYSASSDEPEYLTFLCGDETGRVCRIRKCVPGDGLRRTLPRGVRDDPVAARRADQSLGRVRTFWPWYLPFLSAYETSHISSLSKNSIWAMPSFA